MSKLIITTEILRERITDLVAAGFKLVDADWNVLGRAAYEQVYTGRTAPYGGKLVRFEDTTPNSNVTIDLIVKAPRMSYDGTLYQVKVSHSDAGYGDGRDYPTTRMSDIKKPLAKALALREERIQFAKSMATAEEHRKENLPIAIDRLRTIFGADANIDTINTFGYDNETPNLIVVVYRGIEMKFHADAVQFDREFKATVKIGEGIGYFHAAQGVATPKAFEKVTTSFSASKIKRLIDFTHELGQDEL